MKENSMLKRGDIVAIDFSHSLYIGHEQRGSRFGIVVSNDTGNEYSGNVTVVLCSTNAKGTRTPTQFILDHNRYPKITTENKVMCEHIRTISKLRLQDVMGHLDDFDIERLNKSLSISIMRS